MPLPCTTLFFQACDTLIASSTVCGWRNFQRFVANIPTNGYLATLLKSVRNHDAVESRPFDFSSRDALRKNGEKESSLQSAKVQ